MLATLVESGTKQRKLPAKEFVIDVSVDLKSRKKTSKDLSKNETLQPEIAIDDKVVDRVDSFNQATLNVIYKDLKLKQNTQHIIKKRKTRMYYKISWILCNR